MRGGRPVLLGRIVGLHGVRGAVKLESFTDPRLALFDYRPWSLELASGEVAAIAGVRGHAQGKGIVASLPGVVDRDAAVRFVGARIFVPREALPSPGPGQCYQADLEGLPVVNLAGEALGRVSHLIDNGAHAVLVTRDDAGRERLIPYVVGRYVQSVDLGAGRITVDWDRDD